MSSKRSQVGKYLGEYNYEFLIELGQVIVAFQELESDIKNLCHILINKKDLKLKNRINGQIRFVHLCDLIDKLLTSRKLFKELKEYTLLIEDLKTINDFRNTIIHNVYIPASEKNKMISTKFNKALQVEETGIISEESLELFVDEIDTIIHKFDILARRIKEKMN